MRGADLTPAAAWSRRVRRIGGRIQDAFVVLLGTAAAGFHDLASLRPPGPAQLRTKAR
jgi:hypothetical protein